MFLIIDSVQVFSHCALVFFVFFLVIFRFLNFVRLEVVCAYGIVICFVLWIIKKCKDTLINRRSIFITFSWCSYLLDGALFLCIFCFCTKLSAPFCAKLKLHGLDSREETADQRQVTHLKTNAVFPFQKLLHYDWNETCG